MSSGVTSPNYERMVRYSLDIIGSIDRNGLIVYSNEACKAILGYSSEEVIGQHFTRYLHPDEAISATQAISETLASGKKVNFDTSFFHKSGHVVPIRWSGFWSEEDGLIYCVGRDMTDQVEQKKLLVEREQRFRTLFNNSPDLVFVESREGVITEANQQFLSVLGIVGTEAIGSPASSFLSPPMASVNEASLQQVFLGKTVRFDLVLEHNGEKSVYDTEKLPIKVEGKIVGAQTIARDITPMLHSYDTIQRQAQKLNSIFESITDAFFVLDKDWNFAYINSEAERQLGLNRTYHIGRNAWQEFPSEVNGDFYKQYHRAVETGKAVHFEAYFAGTDIWVEVKAFPSNEGLSIYFDDVSEKVRSRDELKKLSLVASRTTNGVIIMDRAFQIEWVNDGFTKLTGYSLAEARGHTPFDLLYHPEGDSSTIDTIKEKMIQGKPVSFEALRRRKDGGDVWMLVQVNPVLDDKSEVTQYVFIQSDITEKIKTKKELELLSLVASKTNNSVIIANKDWRIEWVNEGFTRLLGYSLEEAVGKRPSEFLHNHKTDSTAFNSLEGRLLQGNPISFEVLNITKSGEEVWVKVDITSLFDKKGELTRFVEVHTDITALKAKEEELTQLAQDLYRQNKDLQQFTYIVSHNLRAPVASALGLANLIPRIDKHTVLHDKSMVHLKESMQRLDTVLRDLNTILSIRDSKTSLEKEDINLKLVIEQALSSLQEQIIKCGGNVTVDVTEDTFVYANRAYMYSIFYNLLSNAIKYRSKKRILEVHVKCEGSAEKGTLIAISDNGSGFDMDKVKDQVFMLYKRFHTDREGRGIGLYLVKTHIEAMDGHIEVNSQPDKGTTFNIYLHKN
ncbi:PAS domain S-box-containing protein [Pontibacter aydingkolensis]|uniref:histidine kinase n=1 Tax=Pontibacter aydingkolensis TaxID=1911536 RepID=A0ABS7CU77_9BACT|nr:PAS domain-containing sensor histidine kinase [Pontibacter aydingkolensis]MBW7467387.1 PAS domain-containing sensor histidine kinase [Pontibacter aydingkolensis]